MAMIEIPDGTIYERIRIWQHRAKAYASPKDWEEYGQTVELLTELLQRRQADRIPIEGMIGDAVQFERDPPLIREGPCCGNLQHPPGGEAMSQLTPQQEQEYVERVWKIEYTVGGEFSSCVVWGRVPRSSPRPNADDWHAAFLYTIERERQITVVEKQIAWLDGLPESWKDDIFGQIHQHAQAVLADLKRGMKEQP